MNEFTVHARVTHIGFGPGKIIKIQPSGPGRNLLTVEFDRRASGIVTFASDSVQFSSVENPKHEDIHVSTENGQALAATIAAGAAADVPRPFAEYGAETVDSLWANHLERIRAMLDAGDKLYQVAEAFNVPVQTMVTIRHRLNSAKDDSAQQQSSIPQSPKMLRAHDINGNGASADAIPSGYVVYDRGADREAQKAGGEASHKCQCGKPLRHVGRCRGPQHDQTQRAHEGREGVTSSKLTERVCALCHSIFPPRTAEQECCTYRCAQALAMNRKYEEANVNRKAGGVPLLEIPYKIGEKPKPGMRIGPDGRLLTHGGTVKCKGCGKEFERKRGSTREFCTRSCDMNHRWANEQKDKKVPVEQVREEYEAGASIPSIAKKIGMSTTGVGDALRKAGVEIRAHTSTQLCKEPGCGKPVKKWKLATGVSYGTRCIDHDREYRNAHRKKKSEGHVELSKTTSKEITARETTTVRRKLKLPEDPLYSTREQIIDLSDMGEDVIQFWGRPVRESFLDALWVNLKPDAKAKIMEHLTDVMLPVHEIVCPKCHESFANPFLPSEG
jgi:endogenous inhibitor of DNA gyrase (YacG/DUF329 family)